jgi:hypothetical protein
MEQKRCQARHSAIVCVTRIGSSSNRTRHWILHLATLATGPGEKRGPAIGITRLTGGSIFTGATLHNIATWRRYSVIRLRTALGCWRSQLPQSPLNPINDSLQVREIVGVASATGPADTFEPESALMGKSWTDQSTIYFHDASNTGRALWYSLHGGWEAS